MSVSLISDGQNSPPRSIAEVQAGHVKRGELVKDGWNYGLFAGNSGRTAHIVWGLFNPENPRFRALCELIDGDRPVQPHKGKPERKRRSPTARAA